MASARRRAPAPLIETLRAAPERFEFGQAVRLLERAAMVAAPPDCREAPAPLGLDDDPRREIVFLRAALEVAFAPSDLTEFDDGGKRPALSVNVMGLNGPSGVLPQYYSRLVLEALRRKSTALRDFLDMFNHRALSLFARAMDKYRLARAYERSGGSGADMISTALYALIGLGEPALRRRLAVADETLLFYAGHFAHRPRTAGALGQILSDYFDCRPVRILQFRSCRVVLAKCDQTRLGARRKDYFAALGKSAVIGPRVYDVQGSFRILLGPLDYRQFLDFMPDGPQMRELADLTRFYVGPALSFDVQLVLRADQVPAAALSSDIEGGSLLGWNTWLPTEDDRADAADAVFDVDGSEAATEVSGVHTA
jgi:type VI secretion system protein ImpH